MKKLVFALGLCIAIGASLSAQNPLTVLPNAYALQFENEWVRIVRVRYEPYAKLPGHEHTALASAYVYLNDGGPVIFKHVGKEYGAVTRPATKARSFRLYRGIDEVHEVKNTSELPSEFLRVEFKTEPKDVATLKGRFFSDVAANETGLRQFENAQVRITRFVNAAGQDVTITASAGDPALLIALTPATYASDRSASPLKLKVGQEHWIPAGEQDRFKNTGTEPAELLRFDLKTAPLSSVR